MVRWRSSEYLAASASNGSPSWNFTPGRSLMVTSLPSAEVSCDSAELRHDVELLVDVEQLVAERGEHDAADIGARERRIENIGILGKADAERGLGLNRQPRATATPPPKQPPNAGFSLDSSPSQEFKRLPAAVPRLYQPRGRLHLPCGPAPSVPPLNAATSRSSAGENPPSCGHDGVGRRQFRRAVAGGERGRRRRPAVAAARRGSGRSRGGSGYESGSPAAD